MEVDMFSIFQAAHGVQVLAKMAVVKYQTLPYLCHLAGPPPPPPPPNNNKYYRHV